MKKLLSLLLVLMMLVPFAAVAEEDYNVYVHPTGSYGFAYPLDWFALDKETGAVVWELSMGTYGWSSPTCVYTPSGKGYVIVGSSSGLLRMFDGLTGEVVAACDLGSNIEGTPIVFDDMLVVGTRGAMVCGVKILGE